MGFPFDTWVASELDVSTKKDDHFPTVAELLWQPLPPCCPVSWHTPLISRASLKDEASSDHFRHWLSLVPVPPVSTPVEAHRAYVVSVLQEAGALFFPVQSKEAKKSWIQEHLANCVIGAGLAQSAICGAGMVETKSNFAYYGRVGAAGLWSTWTAMPFPRKSLASSRSCTVDWTLLNELSTSFSTAKLNLSVTIGVKPPMQS